MDGPEQLLMGFGMKEGRKEKDAEIKNNFNREKLGGLTRSEMANAKKIAIENSRDRAKRKREEREAQKKLQETEKQAEKEEKERKKDEQEDERSTHQMLKDLRWVYRNVKGRTKLKELMEDDKQFVFLIKELVKIETQIMAAKIRNEDPGGSSQTVFVVLKGLDDEKKFNITVDVPKIDQILNPELDQREPEKELSDAEKGPDLS